MWSKAEHGAGAAQKLVVVAIDKNKASQYALKWAVNNLLDRGQILFLLHVDTSSCSAPTTPIRRQGQCLDIHGDGVSETYRLQLAAQCSDLFLPFRCFCKLKNIHCKDVVIEDTDVAKAISEYASNFAIENLVMGYSCRSSFANSFPPPIRALTKPNFFPNVHRRLKSSNVPNTVSRMAPNFCSVYVICKGKMSSFRSSVRPPPFVSPLRRTILDHPSPSPADETQERRRQSKNVGIESMKSPMNKNAREGVVPNNVNRTLPFASPARASAGQRLVSIFDHLESAARPSKAATNVVYGGGENQRYEHDAARRSLDLQTLNRPDPMPIHVDNKRLSVDEIESEMRKLRLELKQSMNLYTTACREALDAKQQARNSHKIFFEEEHKLLKSQAVREAQLQRTEIRYRKYTVNDIEQATNSFSESLKIGEGGYGSVYKCYLDQIPVAVKALRPDAAAQGRLQFHREIEILSSVRHPNMVLLLGACPENDCLVYEYMANGSLEDRLFRRGNTPPLSWKTRFRIAAEVGTGLLFLHQTKPKPLVHRDLKPANILLDNNFVGKINDVGLARLVPENISNSMSQYRLTSTAGTFCYIDPEYQQTGRLGIKSDIYSLGIVLMQLLTGKKPMGLSHKVLKSVEEGTFEEILDPSVLDWPVQDALSLAKIGLKCSELRRKDRPDLATAVLPELKRLRELAREGDKQTPIPVKIYVHRKDKILH